MPKKRYRLEGIIVSLREKLILITLPPKALCASKP